MEYCQNTCMGGEVGREDPAQPCLVWYSICICAFFVIIIVGTITIIIVIVRFLYPLQAVTRAARLSVSLSRIALLSKRGSSASTDTCPVSPHSPGPDDAIGDENLEA